MIRVRSNRWMVFTLVALSYLLIFMQRTGPGVVSNHLQTEFHISAAALGMLSSIQYLLYMVLQIPVGVMADRLGPARLLVLGMLLDGAGTVLFASAGNYPTVLVSRAVVGLGDALIWVNIVLIVGQWFSSTEFGAVIGIVGTGGNLGALLTTVPLATWIGAVGWRIPFLTLGLCLLGLGLADWAMLTGRGRGLRPGAGNDGSARMPTHPLPDTLTHDRSEPGSAMPSERHPQVHHIQVGRVLRIVIRDPLSWTTFLCHCGAMGAYIGFTSVWAVPYFMSVYGVTRVHASTFSLVAFVGAMLGGPVAGAVSDRLGQRRLPYLVAQSVALLSWLSFPLLAGQPPQALAYVAMFLIGAVCGASMLTFAVIRDWVPTERSGVASGFANTGGYVSAVLLPVLFGLVMDAFPKAAGVHAQMAHVYALAFLIPAGFSVIGIVGALRLPRQRAMRAA